MKSGFVKACTAALAFSLISMSAAQSATINITRIADNPQESVYGIRDNTGTDGIDLDGALITATYADGTSEQIVWEALLTYYSDGGGYYSIDGEAVGDDIDLYMAWDGFEMTTTRLMTSLLIQVGSANTVFDTTDIFDDDPLGGSTPTSSFGFPFEIYAGGDALLGSISATYSGIVNLAGRVADGDLYTDMLIDFSGLSTGGFLGDMNFRSDMDTLRYAGDLSPTQVPLPASLPLLLVALGGLGLSRRAANSRA